MRPLDGVRILLVEDDDDTLGAQEDRVTSREAGFHYRLTKPYDVEKITEIASGLVRLTRA